MLQYPSMPVTRRLALPLFLLLAPLPSKTLPLKGMLGWCRTRWSCATLTVELQVRRGITVSAETRRHWLQELGWEWKRAKVVAKDDDPERVTKLARMVFRIVCWIPAENVGMLR